MKTCSKCKQEKELTEFQRRGKHDDTARSQCRDCNLNYGRNDYKAEREKEVKILAALQIELNQRGLKYCKRCNQFKDLDEFGNQSGRTADKKRLCCKECNNASYQEWYRSDLLKARDVSKKWRQNNPEKRQEIWQAYKNRDKDLKLRKAYGIDLIQYTDMLDKQNGVCAICEDLPGKRLLSVDHDHVTGAVRALLCGKCNTALGLLKEDPKIIKSMLDYIS